MPDQEQLEKERRLIAFHEEIQKLIDKAHKAKDKGEEYNFQLMERADSLTEEDAEWWEIMKNIIDKNYSAMLKKFDNNQKAFKEWHEETTTKLNDYKLPPKETDSDRYYFIQEMRNKIWGKLLEFELDLQ